MFLQIVAIQHLFDNAAKWIHRGPTSPGLPAVPLVVVVVVGPREPRAWAKTRAKRVWWWWTASWLEFVVGNGAYGVTDTPRQRYCFSISWPSPSPKKAKFMKQFSSVSRNPINETPLVPIGIPISHGNPIPQPRGKMLGFASGVRKANLRNGLKFPTKKTRFVGFPFTVVTTRILSVLVTFICHNFGEGGQPGQPKV